MALFLDLTSADDPEQMALRADVQTWAVAHHLPAGVWARYGWRVRLLWWCAGQHLRALPDAWEEGSGWLHLAECVAFFVFGPLMAAWGPICHRVLALCPAPVRDRAALRARVRAELRLELRAWRQCRPTRAEVEANCVRARSTPRVLPPPTTLRALLWFPLDPWLN